MPVTPNSIVTPQTPKSATVVASVANTDYDDIPANAAGALITAGPNGARVTRIYAIPRGTVTATQLQLYRSTDAGTDPAPRTTVSAKVTLLYRGSCVSLSSGK